MDDRTDSPKPETVHADLRNLPATLTLMQQQTNWVLWRWSFRKGKWTKVPFQPNGIFAKPDNSETWNTYEACIAAYDGGSFDGIGFCLLGSGFNVFDVDKCRDPETGELKVQAQKLLKRCGDTYAEVTVSGTGIRIIGLGLSNVDRK